MIRDRRPFLVISIVVLATAALLLAMGRVPICTCGTIKLWHGQVMSGENSQHLADWYTPSHIIHGLLFYGLLWLLARRLSFGWRLTLATLLEAAWEIAENSPFIIDRYRTATMALDYYGDSVLNSVSDIFAMMLGFFLASRLPVWATVALILGFEILTGMVIRDGLALNVIMLVWPQDWILDWQSALPVPG